MQYRDLPTPELKIHAHQEAEAFHIDSTQLTDRGRTEGYAIDSPLPSDYDDAISASPDTGNDGDVLHVSISDVGNFIDPNSALDALAARRLRTVYRDDQAKVPMLPAPISEDKLSLLPGVERPVVTVHVPVSTTGQLGQAGFTRDVIVARSLTHEQVGENLASERPDAQLLRLRSIAMRLFKARATIFDLSYEDLVDEEGRFLGDVAGNIGQLVVQECMIATNRVVASYMLEHDIPAIYRSHELPFDNNAFADQPELGRYAAAARYTVRPRQHVGLGISRYMHFTSPIRRRPDMVNHANLAVHLNGETSYPFGPDRINHVIKRMEQMERGEALFERQMRAQRPSPRRAQASSGPDSATVLRAKFTKGVATCGTIALGLFGELPDSSAENIAQLRTEAAAALAADPIKAKNVLQTALAKRLLWLDADRDTTDQTQPAFFVTNQQGERYPYDPSGFANKVAPRTARLLGSLANIVVDPVRLPEYDWQKHVLDDPLGFFLRIEEKYGIPFKSQVLRNKEEGAVTFRATVLINGEKHTRELTASSRKEATKRVLVGLIEEFDLFNMPKKPAETKKKQPAADQTIPTTQLATHAQRSRVAKPNYQNTSTSPEDPIKECTLTFINSDGEPQTITATGTNYQLAKRAAAAKALELLPTMPPKAKKNKK